MGIENMAPIHCPFRKASPVENRRGGHGVDAIPDGDGKRAFASCIRPVFTHWVQQFAKVRWKQDKLFALGMCANLACCDFWSALRAWIEGNERRFWLWENCPFSAVI